MTDRLEARPVAARTIYEGRVIDLRIETVESADGSRREREIVDHRGAAAIVALDRDELLLVRQHRAPARRVLLEIPAGTRDRRPDGTIEEPSVTAARELAEETGVRAAQWRHLASFWTAPGFATEIMDLYLATDLAPAPDAAAAEDERIEVERVEWRRAVEMVERGEIADAKSIVGILWLARLIERGEIVPDPGPA
jgi:ADP-ribose pyrophosphatase